MALMLASELLVGILEEVGLKVGCGREKGSGFTGPFRDSVPGRRCCMEEGKTLILSETEKWTVENGIAGRAKGLLDDSVRNRDGYVVKTLNAIESPKGTGNHLDLL